MPACKPTFYFSFVAVVEEKLGFSLVSLGLFRYICMEVGISTLATVAYKKFKLMNKFLLNCIM